MAIDLLRAVDVQHTAAHDLESFIYLLCWIITLYDGPRSQLRKDSKKLALEGWYKGHDLATITNHKKGCISSASHLDDITEYYSNLHACVAVLSALIHQQQQYSHCIAHEPLNDQVDYLIGFKRRHEDSNSGPPLNHDAVIAILRRTCLYLRGQKIPEENDYNLEPFYLTRKGRTSLFSGGGTTVYSSTQVYDLGGGRYSKKRWILRRIRGPIA